MNGGTLKFLALYIRSILESLNFWGARLLKKRACNSPGTALEHVIFSLIGFKRILFTTIFQRFKAPPRYIIRGLGGFRSLGFFMGV